MTHACQPRPSAGTCFTPHTRGRRPAQIHESTSTPGCIPRWPSTGWTRHPTCKTHGAKGCAGLESGLRGGWIAGTWHDSAELYGQSSNLVGIACSCPGYRQLQLVQPAGSATALSLGHGGEDDRARGHVEAHGKRLGRKQHLRAPGEQLLSSFGQGLSQPQCLKHAQVYCPSSIKEPSDSPSLQGMSECRKHDTIRCAGHATLPGP